MATDPHVEGMVDVDSESAPSVGKDRLYRLWEEGNWSAKHLDFSQDKIDWHEKHTDEQRRAILWNCAMFLDGEESVTVTLAPFVEAAPAYEDKIFLATQLADEARHHIFFDRFLREVCGIGTSISSTLTNVRPQLSWGFRQVFHELDLVANRLRLNPRSLPLLAQGVVLYHIVIEGMLAHTGQHFLREYTKSNNLFPGVAHGLHMVSRDESRHIAFGIQLLRELIAQEPACKPAAITMLNRVLPWAAGVFTPPQVDWNYIRCLGYEPQEIFIFGLRSLEIKLQRAGIPPAEVLALVKLGVSEPVPAQAERVISMIEGGIVGTNQTPRVSEESLDTLFASIGNVASWTSERRKTSVQSQHVTIQWLFDDFQPRYLELMGQQEPQIIQGRARRPDLTLRCKAADWVRISRRSLSLWDALLSRRLRVQGNWRLALQLPKMLPA